MVALRWLLLLAAVLVGCRGADDIADEAAAHDLASAGEFETSLRFTSFASGLGVPLVVTDADDGSERRFVADQTGQILIVDSGGLVDEPFLDISDRLVDLDPSYDERGLLGLAFHPEYTDNGRFFVYYSAPLAEGAPEGWDHTSHISEFTVSDDDPNRADPDSERVVIQVDQPYSNHNAGQISFGPDGYLYIPLGDGGNAGDRDAEGEDLGRPEIGHAQTTENVLGSILRIDVDGSEPYEVPPDNIFAEGGGAEEIFAYGFRNPYGLSFDLETGHLYAADAGQARYEEISQVEPGGNHGWNIREGTHCFNPDDFLDPPEECPETGPDGEPLVDPVVEYERGPESGSVVVPGVMFRGEGIPEMEGRLVFGDYGSIRYLPTGVLYVATPDSGGLWPIEQAGVSVEDGRPSQLERFLLGVDQDSQGRLYLLTTREGGPTGETGEVLLLESAEREGDFWSGALPWILLAVVVVLGLATALGVARHRGRGDVREDGTA